MRLLAADLRHAGLRRVNISCDSLRADRFVVDTAADLAKYGLDKPRTVTVTAEDGKKRVLLVGKLLDGKRLYAFFGKSGVYCLDLDGKEVWRANVGTGTHGWGSANSPVLFQNLVIVTGRL